MPNAHRVCKSLQRGGFSLQLAQHIADVVEIARTPPGAYDEDQVTEILYQEGRGFSEPIAEEISKALRHCFPQQRFAVRFKRAPIKASIVAAGMKPAQADAFLDVIDSCVVTARNGEIRVPIRHQISPGRVVMCDFSYLRKPEMQKERRAIVVSARTPNDTGRCAVVPVSKSESAAPNACHFEFGPGTYPYFHPTEPVWAVCDHVYTVSLDRLWAVNVRYRPQIDASISKEHLIEIRNRIGTTLGIGR